MKKHVIKEVLPGSIAEELEIKPGSLVLAVNDEPIEDVFDYDFLCENTEVNLLVEEASGEQVLYEIEKDEDEDLGLRFENGLMDEYKSCRNKCVFCFIDQMPPGMRETLYFKDDDSRLSFLQGNYVTLTGLSDKDIDRIIRYRLSPINISIHTMNPALRCRMLHNRFAGESLKKLDTLFAAGVRMNGQIVLCPGWNDGSELEYTVEALSRYLPCLESVSVVPVGLTRYRQGLEPLAPVTKEIAERTIDLIEAWQQKLYPRYGLHFIHASDEFYLLAGRELPEEERYDGYIQLENGVGMLRLLTAEFESELEQANSALDPAAVMPRRVSLATGRLAAPLLSQLTQALQQAFPGVRAELYPIRNDFFGESITVSGLVTGQDLLAQLKGKDLGEALYLPLNMLRSGEDVFLDDVHVPQLSEALGVPIFPLECDGALLVRTLLGVSPRELYGEDDFEEETDFFRPYELKETT